jgi:hypothetical protein
MVLVVANAEARVDQNPGSSFDAEQIRDSAMQHAI